MKERRQSSVPAAVKRRLPKLSALEEAFVKVYVQTGDKGLAGAAIGSDADDPVTTANTLLAKRNVKRAIRLIEEAEAERIYSPAKVLRGWAEIARADVLDLFEIDPETDTLKMRDLDKIPAGTRYSIRKIKLTAEGKLESVEMESKLSALNSLARRFRLLSPDDLPDRNDGEVIDEETTFERRVERLRHKIIEREIIARERHIEITD